MDDRNPYAPSRASLAQPAQPGLDGSDGVTAWRYRQVLVMVPDTALPSRCVKCNQPADEPTKLRKVYWHHPGVYALILVNIVIYAIVGAIVRKRALVAAGLCAAHKKRRRVAVAVAWIGFITGMGLLTWGVGDTTGYNGVFAVAGLIVLLVSILVGINRARIVYAQKIETSHVWLKGCGAEFLDSLPPLPDHGRIR
jgi:hypothetical protein